MRNKRSKNSNHEADIQNPNKKTKGQNSTYVQNTKNKKRQLKEERDRKANEGNPNNTHYKGPKKEK